MPHIGSKGYLVFLEETLRQMGRKASVEMNENVVLAIPWTCAPPYFENISLVYNKSFHLSTPLNMVACIRHKFIDCCEYL